MTNKEQKVVAVQVSPFKAVPDYDLQIELQPEGADEKTIGYCVCLRYEDKTFEIVDKKKYERDAIAFAKDICVEYQVSIELFAWQVPYINPSLEALRKSYPPTFEVLKDKAKSWAKHLAKTITSAWEDGVVLSIHDRNGPVNPFPVLSGDYPEGWGSYSATAPINVPEVGFMKAPEAATASVVAKYSTFKFDGDPAVDPNKRFIGQYMPRDLGPKGVITGIVIGNEVPGDMDASRAEIIMAPEGSLIGGVIRTSQIDQMAVRGTDLDDSIAAMASSTNKPPKTVQRTVVEKETGEYRAVIQFNEDRFGNITGKWPTFMQVGFFMVDSAIHELRVPTDDDLAKAYGVTITASAEPNAVHLETSLQTGETIRVDGERKPGYLAGIAAAHKSMVEREPGKGVDLSTFTGTIDTKTMSATSADETDYLPSPPASAFRLEESVKQLKDRSVKFTFESRGDHSPSKE